MPYSLRKSWGPRVRNHSSAGTFTPLAGNFSFLSRSSCLRGESVKDHSFRFKCFSSLIASPPHSCVLLLSKRHRVTNASILTNIKDMVKDSQDSNDDSLAFLGLQNRKGDNAESREGGEPVEDIASKQTYAKKRQKDALLYSIKEKEILSEKAKKQLQEEDEEREDAQKIQAFVEEAAKLGGPAAAERMREKIREQRAKYVKSVDAFGDKSVRLQHTFAGLADNRIIHWYERLYWNYFRYFFTQELLIAKDRFGNKFTATWQFNKARGEQRRMYRKDANKRHQPYGSLATDDRLWERWLRGHRADPPSVAEEEHYRSYKKSFFGAIVVEDEEVEDTLMRLMAHLNRAQSTFQELDEDQVYGDANRATQPIRQTDRSPGAEAEVRKKQKGATWTMGFVRGDLFYNEEETQVMRSELGHLFRAKEWQELEYKRQVRKNKQQPPHGMPPAAEKGRGDDGSSSNRYEPQEAIDPNTPDGVPMNHYWERTDLGIPYDAAIPDLTTPALEKHRIETDQLEDERLALRKELGLTDLGDIREGRDPVIPGPVEEVLANKDGNHWMKTTTGEGPFQPPPVTSRWKPKCWEEPWGTGGGFLN